jgi:biopolymer transport protein ExbD
MVPFIDIMLVLLTIVLTTSSFIATGRLPIKLPEASAAASDERRDEVEIIELTADGSIYHEAGLVTIAELSGRLALLDRKTQFLLRADREVRLQSFVDLADLLKKLSFSQVAVQTDTIRSNDLDGTNDADAPSAPDGQS